MSGTIHPKMNIGSPGYQVLQRSVFFIPASTTRKGPKLRNSFNVGSVLLTCQRLRDTTIWVKLKKPVTWRFR